MRILCIVFLTLYFQEFSFSKTIIVDTNNKKLRSKDVGFFRSKREFLIDYNSTKENNSFEIKKGNIVFNSYRDSIIIEIGNNIPIFIQGLKSIQSDSIIISDINLIKYNSIDSTITEISKPIRKQENKYSTSKKEYFPLGSKQIVPENITISINGKEYSCTLIVEPYNKSAVYCTPDKISYHVKTNGFKKYYHLIL